MVDAWIWSSSHKMGSTNNVSKVWWALLWYFLNSALRSVAAGSRFNALIRFISDLLIEAGIVGMVAFVTRIGLPSGRLWTNPGQLSAIRATVNNSKWLVWRLLQLSQTVHKFAYWTFNVGIWFELKQKWRRCTDTRTISDMSKCLHACTTNDSVLLVMS